MAYLDAKTKRVINRNTGAVDAVIAYAMSADFSHMLVAASFKHKDDKADFTTGCNIALQRLAEFQSFLESDAVSLNNTLLGYIAAISYTDEDLEVFSSGLKLQQIKKDTKLRYVELTTIMNAAYKKLGICTETYR